MIKSKGHNTKYQAVALLYKLIKDNNLDFKETLQELYLKMRYFVKKLRKYHNVLIDIEKRNGFI